MKILHINNSYSIAGGAEAYLKSLMEMFNEGGHETYLFAVDREVELEESRTVVYKDSFKRGPLKYLLWYYFNPMLYIKLRSMIKKVKPDIIHVHNNMVFTSTILLALMISKIPVVQTVHDHSIICPSALYIKPDGQICEGVFSMDCARSKCIPYTTYLYQRIPEYLIRYLQNHEIDTYIAPSIALKDRLTKNGYKNVINLPNFVDTKYFHFNRSGKTPGNLLYIGALSDRKGVKYLIESLARVIDKCPYCRLNIVGSGPTGTYLQKFAMDLGLDKFVTFYGQLTGDELKNLYERADIVIIPSICMENSPIVAYESMASGCAIVGSDIGGIPDLIKNGINGFLCTPRSSSEIADSIIKIVTDRELSERMSRTNREMCGSTYDKSIYYNKLLDIYHMLILTKNNIEER